MSVTITITDPSSTPVAELEAAIVLLRNFVPAATLLINEATDQRSAIADFRAKEPPLSESGVTPVIPQPPVAAAEAFGASSIPAAATSVPRVELDKEGLPWDGRIHASTKTKTVEGVWKKKRNLDPSFLASVVEELKATMSAPAPTASVVPPPPPPTASVVPPPPPPIAPGLTFAEFMAKVTSGVTEGAFTREDVAAACVAQGVPNLPGLINRPDLIPAVARELGLTV